MGEGRVAYHGHGGMLTGVGSSFRHGDGGSHIYRSVKGIEGREESKGIATDVTEYFGRLVACEHIVERMVHIAVTATLTEGRRTAGDH